MNEGEMQIRAAIGARIESEIKRLGLTPDDFAVKVGFSRATVFNWKAGTRMPDALALHEMQRQAGVDVQFIVTGERMSISTLTCTQEEVAKRLGDMPARLQQLVADITHVTWLAFDARRSYDYNAALSTGDARPAPVVHEEGAHYGRKKR